MAAVRPFFNIVGGAVTLASVVLPWRVLNGGSRSVFEVWNFGYGLILIIPWLILVGGCSSIFSRYSGMITVVGAIAYIASLPGEFGLGSNSAPPPSSSGVGYWISWAGSIISLIGKSWNLPFLERLLSRI